MALALSASAQTENKVQCTAITKAGTQCRHHATKGTTLCTIHTPVPEADRCKATTKQGTQCKRKHNDHSAYCTQHEKAINNTNK